MNAHAILAAQGWRGKGHSLHPTSDTIGLSKPLLFTRKPDTKGLGNSAASQFAAESQWWLSAYDEQLKGINTSRAGTVVQTETCGRLNTVVAGGALGGWSLWSSFVRGGFLEGTMSMGGEEEADAGADTQAATEETAAITTATTTPQDSSEERIKIKMPKKISKRDKESGDDDTTEGKEEKRARREERRARRGKRRLQKAMILVMLEKQGTGRAAAGGGNSKQFSAKDTGARPRKRGKTKKDTGKLLSKS